MSFDQLASPDRQPPGVFAGLVEYVCGAGIQITRRPGPLVRLPRSSAPTATIVVPGLLSNAVLLNGGASEDECARGCVYPLAVELERRAPALDEVKLLLQVMLLCLVVLVFDEPIAHLAEVCKCIDARRT